MFNAGSNLLLILFFVTAALAPGWSQCCVRADQLFSQGKFSQAQRAYRRVRRGDKNAIHANIRLGEIALLRNQTSQAEHELQLVLTEEPANVEAERFLAEAYVREHRFSAAAELYRKLDQPAKAEQLQALARSEPYQMPPAFREARVPFVQIDPLPLVEAAVNGGEPFYFLIDTGGADIILDDALAERIGIPSLGNASGTFAGGKKASFGRGIARSISLGGLTVQNIPVSIQSTSRYAAVAQGKPVAGIIGTVFLSQFQCTLDYAKGELVLRASGARVKKAKREVSLPFWLADDHLILAEGTINQTPPMLMLVDTGLAGMGLAAPAATLEAAGVNVSGQTVEGEGGAGKVQARSFKADSVSLGTVRRTDILGVAGVFPSVLENVEGLRVGALVSHQFFARTAVTFDFVRMRIHLAAAD